MFYLGVVEHGDGSRSDVGATHAEHDDVLRRVQIDVMRDGRRTRRVHHLELLGRATVGKLLKLLFFATPCGLIKNLLPSI